MQPWVAVLGVWALIAVDAAPLGTQVKASGKTHKLSPTVDSSMCMAVVTEMDAEIKRHDLKKHGEAEIFDTAGMAICLGVVQNYMMFRDGSDVWSMRKKTKEELEDGDSHDEESVTGMYILKEACVLFCDELQQEISEAAYSPSKQPEQFCAGVTASKDRPARKQKKPVKPLGEGEAYNDMLKKMYEDPDMRDLMHQDRFFPESRLPEAVQESIKLAEAALACEVCRTAADLAITAAFKLPKTAKGVIDEAAVGTAVHKHFFSVVPEESADYKPGDPPLWSEQYIVTDNRGWKLSKAKPKELKALDQEGTVLRNVVVARACKAAHASTDQDLAEMIVDWWSMMTKVNVPIEGRALEDARKLLARKYCSTLCEPPRRNDEL
ncbi:hypothetical protein DIPPA_14619 [Diplonema papillatum]|nr:hypothetical protein DIPPA_14619 [Diplonema papillatum]